MRATVFLVLGMATLVCSPVARGGNITAATPDVAYDCVNSSGQPAQGCRIDCSDEAADGGPPGGFTDSIAGAVRVEMFFTRKGSLNKAGPWWLFLKAYNTALRKYVVYHAVWGPETNCVLQVNPKPGLPHWRPDQFDWGR